jgi:hypothetical protein
MKKIYFLILASCFALQGIGQTTFFWRSVAINGNWNNSTDNWWNGSAVALPGGGEVLDINNNDQLTMTNNLAATNRYRIFFNSNATSARTVTGSTSNTFFDFGGNKPKIENQSSANHVIAFPFALGNNNGLELNPVNGDLTFNSAINATAYTIWMYSNTGAPKSIFLNANISNSGFIYILNKTIMSIGTGGSVGGGGTIYVENGTLRFTGTGTVGNSVDVRISSGQTMDLNNVNVTVRTIAERASGNAGTISLGSGILTVAGNITGTYFQNSISGTGGLIKQNSDVLSLYGTQGYTGNTEVQGGTLASGSSMQSATILVKSGATFSAADNITVKNVTLESGATLNIAAGKTLTIDGTLSMHPSATINNNGTGVLAYTGANSKLLIGGTTAYTTTNTIFPATNGPKILEINNAGGVTLHAARTLDNSLIFTNGILTTTASNLLTLNTSATVSGTIDNTRFVNGPIAKIGTTAFTFPTGKAGSTNRLGRCAVGANATAGTIFTAEYFVAAPPTLPSLYPQNGLGSLSASEHWDIARSAGGGDATVTLYFDDGTFSGVTSGAIFSGLTVGHRTSTTAASWQSETSSAAGSPVAGSVTTTSALTTFSPFTIGTINGVTLPLAVNSFTASKQNSNTNTINWKATCTGASVNFELLRSTNGLNFAPVYNLTATQARCAASFNYVDNYNATSPITYYKLKVTSNTGEIKYSQIIAINNKNTIQNNLSIYPNVIKDNAILIVESKTNLNANFVITDAKGAVVRKFNENLSEGSNAYPINVSNLSAGSYQISGIVDGALKTIRFIKSL